MMAWGGVETHEIDRCPACWPHDTTQKLDHKNAAGHTELFVSLFRTPTLRAYRIPALLAFLLCFHPFI
jgi:hypothetical protein